MGGEWTELVATRCVAANHIHQPGT
ncbi:uncharacterized protein G2W53_008513 [Senna tora]|uniref:Uncharacterized protein n=1 Tax=Senna tora TaxID=362788 RepID=A0A835CFX2_9FABA|nr:uncharacterized protein G2W53_008505 [Senna tora]KAF7840031.1 uncharacterized protein G2W53_008513 [Senna tora]